MDKLRRIFLAKARVVVNIVDVVFRLGPRLPLFVVCLMVCRDRRQVVTANGDSLVHPS